jgi:hypothetical protein
MDQKFQPGFGGPRFAVYNLSSIAASGGGHPLP